MPHNVDAGLSLPPPRKRPLARAVFIIYITGEKAEKRQNGAWQQKSKSGDMAAQINGRDADA